MQKTLITIGLTVLVIGLLWPWLKHIPLGRLPGDIVVSKPNLKVFFPVTSMILISVILSLIFYLFRK